MSERTVLLVDDEIHVVKILERRFQSLGWATVIARNGSEAVDAAEASCPDIMVIDFQMPVMDGLETAERMAGLDSTRGMPIVMLTARGHRVETERVEATNIRAMLQKPFSARDVVAKVQDVLEGACEIEREAA